MSVLISALTSRNLIAGHDHLVHLIRDLALLLVGNAVPHLPLRIGMLDVDVKETWIDGVHDLEQCWSW